MMSAPWMAPALPDVYLSGAQPQDCSPLLGRSTASAVLFLVRDIAS